MFRVIIFLSFAVFYGCSPKTSLNKEEHAINSKIDSLLNNEKFNGIILVSENDSIVYVKAKGYADFESKTPLNISDLFVIGSVSKQIAAVLVLKAYENGELKLHDPISKYLPEISQDWANEVTIHHLLTHTHGIEALDKPLAFEVGSEFKYSQLGYELLANILEKIEGKSFRTISTAFFKEIGLENTFHPEDTTYSGLVKGYVEEADGKLVYEVNSLENYVPAGAFISNVFDLQKWNMLLHSGELVKKETLVLMKTRYATREHPIFNKVEYGYGLLFKLGEENLEIGALGYAPAFVSACYYYPKSDRTIVVLENVAYNLEDFKKTFKVHTSIMSLAKEFSL